MEWSEGWACLLQLLEGHVIQGETYRLHSQTDIAFFYHFFKIFLKRGPFLKSSFGFCSGFKFWPQGMGDLNSPTGIKPTTPALKSQVLPLDSRGSSATTLGINLPGLPGAAQW